MAYVTTSYYYEYPAEYVYSYTYDTGVVDYRTIVVPTDYYDRYVSYAPQHTISNQSFMKAVNAILNGPNATDQQIVEAFNILDADGSGRLDASELAKVIPAIIPGTTLDTLNTLIRRYDKNFDNQLNLSEFTRLVKGGLARDLVYRDVIIY